jgi:hypothetical protein
MVDLRVVDESLGRDRLEVALPLIFGPLGRVHEAQNGEVHAPKCWRGAN